MSFVLRFSPTPDESSSELMHYFIFVEFARQEKVYSGATARLIDRSEMKGQRLIIRTNADSGAVPAVPFRADMDAGHTETERKRERDVPIGASYGVAGTATLLSIARASKSESYMRDCGIKLSASRGAGRALLKRRFKLIFAGADSSYFTGRRRRRRPGGFFTQPKRRKNIGRAEPGIYTGAPNTPFTINYSASGATPLSVVYYTHNMHNLIIIFA